MESFFFNITDKSYKITENEDFKRVDISNGIVFLDIKTQAQLHMKNLDRMVILTVTKNGKLTINDKVSKKSQSNIYCSSRQDFTINAHGEIFILFIADFFLKRYLSSNKNEPIDFLYQKIQNELMCELIDTQPVDALSLYIINKVIQEHSNMNSIRCEHYLLEFLIHRLSLLDIIDSTISKEELEIVKRAKNNLLKSFANPPTISELAHLCATNESKLKITFKKVYKTTIYNYIQKRRLEVANLLLKEQVLTIGEIAKEVGYKHQGHFSKLFFQNFGVYPKDLLKR
jgi:AraC-like DNA-binding protein